MLPISGRPINADRRPKFPCGVRISPDTRPSGSNTASRVSLELEDHGLRSHARLERRRLGRRAEFLKR